MMQLKEIENLLERYNAGTANRAEKAIVEAWYLKYEHSDPLLSHSQLEDDQRDSLDQLLKQIKGRKRILWPGIAAAMLVFFIAGGYFLISNKLSQQKLTNTKPQQHDVAPGGNKAIITLGDGSKIVLNGAHVGTLGNQGNTVIKKTRDGQITYVNSNREARTKDMVYNTATTPLGGQYQFILSDGTKVWLNAASSIKYPVAFNGKERKVELIGEAYFEVAHNAGMPFKVISNNQTVEVLGTHFNINAYDDEDVVKTTLLEGGVKVSTVGTSNVIKPGEQTVVKHGEIRVAKVDVNQVIAWKNGFFNFDHNNIQEAMRLLSRWYGVEVKYEGAIPIRTFSGEISRDVSVSQMLDILTFKEIKYRIDGKKITIIN
jgi:transmembrane sensor